MMPDPDGAGAHGETRSLNAGAAERNFVDSGEFLRKCRKGGKALRDGVRSKGCGSKAASGMMQECAAAHKEPPGIGAILHPDRRAGASGGYPATNREIGAGK